MGQLAFVGARLIGAEAATLVSQGRSGRRRAGMEGER